MRPKGYVTDFRTKWSGVRKENLRKGEAIPFEQVNDENFFSMNMNSIHIIIPKLNSVKTK